MRSSEKWGVDVETAVSLALKDLKLERDEVEVEVLEESSSGFLGIGSKLAKVRVTAKEEKNSNTKEKATFCLMKSEQNMINMKRKSVRMRAQEKELFQKAERAANQRAENMICL